MPTAAKDLIGPFMQAVLTCAQAGLSVPVNRAALYPGSEVAWDDCCGGQLWVRLVSLTPFGTTPGAIQSPCGPLFWQASLAIGVLRCASSVDDAGNAPSPALLTGDTLRMTQDMADLQHAIQCCLAPQVTKMSMDSWLPLGPEGGCMGGEWLITVMVDNCKCP